MATDLARASSFLNDAISVRLDQVGAWPPKKRPLGSVYCPPGDGALQRLGAVLGGVGGQRRDGGGPARIAPVLRHDRVPQLVIGGIGGIGLRMVDEVAVEVDIVLGHAPYPGEAMRVDGVDRGQRRAARHLLDHAVGEPGHLAQRAAEALDAVRARDRHEDALGIRRSPPRDIGEQPLGIRPAQRMLQRRHLRAGGAGGGKELGARVGIVAREMLNDAHDPRTCWLKDFSPRPPPLVQRHLFP